MKFICYRDSILKVVNAGEVVASGKADFSNAAMLLLEATETEIRLKASNLNATIESPVKHESIAQAGSISVHQTRLASLLRELGEEMIEIDLQDENIIHLLPAEGKRKVSVELYGVPAAEFPELPALDARRPGLSIEKSLLRKMIQRTGFAAATNPTQYALNGIYMTYENETLSVITTDGRRMALYHHKIGPSEHEPFKVILSREFLNHFQRSLHGEGPVTFVIDENRIFFKLDDMLLSSLFIDGDYPNYQSFIPSSYKQQLTVETAVFKKAIKTLLSAYTNIELSFNKILLDFSKGKMKVSSQTKNAARTDEEISCMYTGDKMKIAFNVKMLNEIVDHIDEAEISFQWNDTTSPVMLKGVGDDECSYILMPIKEGDF